MIDCFFHFLLLRLKPLNSLSYGLLVLLDGLLAHFMFELDLAVFVRFRIEVVCLADLNAVRQAVNVGNSVLADVTPAAIQNLDLVKAISVVGKAALQTGGFAAAAAQIRLRLRATLLA